MTEAPPAAEIVVDVDAHKHVHAAVAISALGARLGATTVPVGGKGYRALEAWARSLGPVRAFGVEGTSRPAAGWVGKGGRARKLRRARVTSKGRPVGAVVRVHAEGMKEPWCPAAGDPEAPAAEAVDHHAKRWTIEPASRDAKDPHFGMGPPATRIGEPTRRDRLLPLNAFAMCPLDRSHATRMAGSVTRHLRQPQRAPPLPGVSATFSSAYCVEGQSCRQT